jgi:predicted kinase
MGLLIATVGLPRSGKSQWCRKFAESHNSPIVNPDSIRLALHGQRFAPESEGFVWAIAKVMVRSLFMAGHEVVLLDATNVTRKRRAEWRSKDWSVVFKLIETTLTECCRRALGSSQPEMVEVIHRMQDEYEVLGPDESQMAY